MLGRLELYFLQESVEVDSAWSDKHCNSCIYCFVCLVVFCFFSTPVREVKKACRALSAGLMDCSQFLLVS